MKRLEALGIDPSTSRMLSERSTIWAMPPLSDEVIETYFFKVFLSLNCETIDKNNHYLYLYTETALYLDRKTCEIFWKSQGMGYFKES